MRATKGFTLIEMLVVMVILGVLAVGASSLVIAGFRNYFTGVQLSGLNQEATIAMLRMSKEIKTAVSFTSMTASSVSFRSIDGLNISYSWANPVLTRTGTSARTLSGTVTSFSIAYYQSNFTSTASVTAVRAVSISMTLSNGNETVSLINTVFLDNMK